MARIGTGTGHRTTPGARDTPTRMRWSFSSSTSSGGRTGSRPFDTLKDLVGQPHPRMAVMIDVESWQGQITGNQSDGLNKAYQAIADWLGDRRRVIAYGNRGDLNSLWPYKPDWTSDRSRRLRIKPRLPRQNCPPVHQRGGLRRRPAGGVSAIRQVLHGFRRWAHPRTVRSCLRYRCRGRRRA